MSSDAIAIANLARGLAQPSAGEIEDAARLQAGIDAAMRGVIASPYNPNRLEQAAKVGVAGAVPAALGAPLARGTGWAEARPLALPAGQDAIERLVNAVLPHGPESKAGGRREDVR
jgi:hypothetical protein